MHIPDGFLNTPTIIATNTISLSILAIAIRKVNKSLTPKRVPMMGIAGAFVFMAQLISFPIFGGTSIHITGSVLISILLGPFSGLVIITCALIMQLIVQHGGLFSMGANILNIGIIGCLFGYLIYKIFKSSLIGAFLAGWFSTIIAAIFCAVELGVSGIVPLKTAILSMGTAHLIVGIIEGFITFIILGTIRRIRPDLLELEKI